MAKTLFFKVTALPAIMAPNAFYFVDNGDYAESYVTDSSGSARAVGNTAMIEEVATALLGASAVLNKVVDIAARDTLIATLTANALILVVDASADATVTAGAALYFYDYGTTTTTKVAEYESMDVVISWAGISGKPSSTPIQIDNAVSSAHTHSNKAQLDKIGEDGDGDATYNGQPIQKWNTTSW